MHIIEGLPPHDEVSRRHSFFDQITNAAGIPSWLWKTWTGRIIAVVFVIPTISATGNFWKSTISSTYQNPGHYIEFLRKHTPQVTDNLVAFLGSGQSDLQNLNDVGIVAPRVSTMRPSQLNLSSSFTGSLWRVQMGGQTTAEKMHSFLDYQISNAMNRPGFAGGS